MKVIDKVLSTDLFVLRSSLCWCYIWRTLHDTYDMLLDPGAVLVLQEFDLNLESRGTPCCWLFFFFFFKYCLVLGPKQHTTLPSIGLCQIFTNLWLFFHRFLLMKKLYFVYINMLFYSGCHSLFFFFRLFLSLFWFAFHYILYAEMFPHLLLYSLKMRNNSNDNRSQCKNRHIVNTSELINEVIKVRFSVGRFYFYF